MLYQAAASDVTSRGKAGAAWPGTAALASVCVTAESWGPAPSPPGLTQAPDR